MNDSSSSSIITYYDSLAERKSTSDVWATRCWTVAAIFLLFFCLTHLGVLFCFSFGVTVPAFTASVAFLVALVGGVLFARREGMRGRQSLWAPLIAVIVAAIAWPLSAAFFDMSWDGLWYHQTAVYQMAHGWNPLRDPMREFTPHLQDWLRHYAKGSWYASLALFQMTNDVEWCKPESWIMTAVTLFTVTAACLDFDMSKRKSVLVAVLVALNPVVTCEMPTYLVDGLLVSFLACFAAALAVYFKRRSPLILCVMISSAILLMNVKLTGVVFFCLFCAAGGLYVLIKRRDLLFKYALLQIATLAFGVLLFGYNPYVTNTVHRNHPFYPLAGTKTFPSHDQQGRDPVELYETPRNMMGRSAWHRHFYSIFGHPGAFYVGNPVELMWPFCASWTDFGEYRYHEERIAGFGPLFSGALIISLPLLAIAFYRRSIPREVLLLTVGVIVVSLTISRHTWWARFVPHFWWLPIVAVIAALAPACRKFERLAAGAVATVLLINSILIAFVHFQWEIDATRQTYSQMAFLRDKGDVEIDFQFFHEPFSERLKAGGVTFHATHRLTGKKPFDLLSVVPINPGSVRACIKEDE